MLHATKVSTCWLKTTDSDHYSLKGPINRNKLCMFERSFLRGSSGHQQAQSGAHENCIRSSHACRLIKDGPWKPEPDRKLPDRAAVKKERLQIGAVKSPLRKKTSCTFHRQDTNTWLDNEEKRHRGAASTVCRLVLSGALTAPITRITGNSVCSTLFKVLSVTATRPENPI